MSYDERITIYYGDAVMRAGFLTVPHLFMRHYASLGLNADQAMFALQLMSITWDLAQPPDTMKKLAQRMGVSLRTAQRFSEQLSEHGLLTVYEQFEAGAQVENGYDLSPLFKRLAAFAPEPRPGGELRERRVRPGTAQSAEHVQMPAAALEHAPGKIVANDPMTEVTSLPLSFLSPPPITLLSALPVTALV